MTGAGGTPGGVGAFFGGAALRICDSLLPRLAADFGRTPGQAGQVIISFSVAYGLMQLAGAASGGGDALQPLLFAVTARASVFSSGLAVL